jgi:hypothetical protein
MTTTWTEDDVRELDSLSDEDLIRIAGEPLPLTKPQRATATLDRRRALKAAQRTTARSATIGFVILFLALSVAVYEQKHDASEARQAIASSANAVAVTTCNRLFVAGEQQRTALVALRAEVTRAQANKVVSLPDCRTVGDQITDDPDDTISPPVPLYPGVPVEKRE